MLAVEYVSLTLYISHKILPHSPHNHPPFDFICVRLNSVTPHEGLQWL